jgi:hypothetical protein
MNVRTKEKPIRELLQDISHTMDTSHSERGFICPKILNRICFVASVLSVLLVATVLLAMIWQSIDPATGLKYMATVLVVLFALLIFRSINGAFAE